MGDEGRTGLRDAVGEREAEVGNKELLDVRAANIIMLGELDHTENLQNELEHSSFSQPSQK